MSAIDKLQNDFNNWYEDSPIREYMCRWKAGLKSFVPEKHQENLFPQPMKIFITQEKEEINIWQQENGEINIYTPEAYESDEQEQQWWEQIKNIITQADGKKVEVSFLLSNQQALVRKIALPEAAKENLSEVIGFELDKYVPFKADQVNIAYKVDKTNQNEEKILMDLVVATKHNITNVLNLCHEKNIALDRIDVNKSTSNQEPSYIGVNLLPPENRKANDYTNLKINLMLFILLVGLIYFVMYISISNKKNKIENLTIINTELQKQARQSKLFRKELKSTIVSSKFLQNKKQDNPTLVTILSEVTTILPDHTYLTRFKLDHEKLEIEGRSNNANSLVPKLDKSTKWFSPEISGVTNDRVTNKEKFTIKALLDEPKPEDKDDSKS